MPRTINKCFCLLEVLIKVSSSVICSENGCELFVGLWFKALDQDHGMDMLWLWWGKDFSWLLVEMMVSYFPSLASYFIALPILLYIGKDERKGNEMKVI